jgi:hypothetical protein
MKATTLQAVPSSSRRTIGTPCPPFGATAPTPDGQYFRSGGRAGPGRDVNARYGIDPGVVLYTTQFGQYGPLHTRVISATASEAPCVLDGLHPRAHRASLRIAEHYTDTAGATDHVFGLCHLLGYRFAPRIKDLKDRELYAAEKPDTYPVLKPLIGDAVDTAALVRGWAELLRVRAKSVPSRRPLSCASSPRPAQTMPSPRHYGPCDPLSVRCSLCNGCPTRRCVSAAMPDRIKARPAMRSTRRVLPSPGRVPRPDLRKSELPGIGTEPDDRSHRPLEHHLP